MAVETLTKAALRAACVAHACDPDGLVVVWGLAEADVSADEFRRGKQRPDGEARRRFIFHDDGPCQKATLAASDRFEHGFADFNEIREFAVQAKELGAAQHIRRAIFELVALPADSISSLTAPRYEKPRTTWPMTKYVRGTFLGPSDESVQQRH